MRIIFLYNFQKLIAFLFFILLHRKYHNMIFFKWKFDFHMMLRFYLKNHSSN